MTSTSIPSALRSSAAARQAETMRDQDTRVMSPPSRATFAIPIGSSCPSIGISPFASYSTLCSMKTTGFGSRMADFSRPLASAELLGITTLSPGIWLTQVSSVCECWAA